MLRRAGSTVLILAFERVRLEGQKARLHMPQTSTLHEGRQKSLAHTEAWSLAMGENKIRFVVFSEEKQQFLEKCYA
jgi:hypothetical protein